MTQTKPRFACQCGKTFRWKQEIAGRKAKCPCGRTLEVPKTIDEAPELSIPETFDIPEEELTRQPAHQSAPAISAKTGAAIKSMSTPSATSASSTTKAAAPLNWKGAVWLFVGVALAIGGAVKHIVDPHDPSIDNGRRVRAWETIINVVYNIGGNGAVIAAFFLLALILAGLAYGTLMNKFGTKDD
jgi:hypothetical protein